ncbi:MAG: Lrp/AsnC family transcriptional regulator [Nanoarchaeota archaeon]
MKRDTKDRKILSALDLNARATFQEIGKRVGLSKEVVLYRIRRLEKRRILLGYTTLVNFSKLGYTGFGIFSRFQNVNEQVKIETLDYLKNIPEIYWIATLGGKFDLSFGVMCKSIFQFNKLYYQILNKYGKNLTDNKIAIRSELRQSKRSYLDNNKKQVSKFPLFGEEPELEIIDSLDSNILSILSTQARMPIVELAQILKKPASTLTFRIRDLEKRKIIQGYTPHIKSQNYGMQSYRLLLFLENMNETSRKKLFNYAQENPFMILAVETVGEWNFEVTLEVESHEQLQIELSKLRNTFMGNIRNVESLIMFEDDLLYDPYPLKKKQRELLLKNKALK